MPQTRIDTRRGWLGERRQALLDALQRALVDGLRIPANDRSIVLCEHDEAAFLVPEGSGAGFMVVQITLITGRSLEAKRRLFAAIVEEMKAFGVRARDVRVVLVESAAENWGVAGRPASEIDLGFRIDV